MPGKQHLSTALTPCQSSSACCSILALSYSYREDKIERADLGILHQTAFPSADE